MTSSARGEPALPLATPREPFGLWGRAFRPFFLGAAVYAALAIPAWTAIWLDLLPAPDWLPPAGWHGHEMLFGFVAAAVAGFLLTASPVWTGRPALTGPPLAGLFVLWLAGRLGFTAAGVLPAWLLAALDVAFLPAVAGVVARTVWGTGQYRNYGVVGLVALLAGANAVLHAEALGLVAGLAARALRFGVDTVVVLLLVIGGRITPAFTANALLRARPSEAAEATRPLRSWPWLDALAIAAAAALAFTSLLSGRTTASGLLALLAGAAAAARSLGWRPWHTPVRSDPLLWSLHLGVAWVAVGLGLVGLADLGAPVPPAAGLHALAAGAMGTSILAVMTRVSLGHTGRPLELPPGVAWAYALVSVAALARVAATFSLGGTQPVLLAAGGLLWASGFALFLARYLPILISPRSDGRPG